MVELVETQLERTNLEHANILRWEDDGGQAIEYRDRTDRFNPEPAKRNNQANGATSDKGIGMIAAC
jgi:hypothetical protein